MVGIVHYAELSSGLMLLRSHGNFADYVRDNSDEYLDAARHDLSRARQLGQTELLIGELAEWFEAVYEVLNSSYAPRRLAEFQCLPDEYLQLLLTLSRRAFYLWPGQAGALEAGLFSSDTFAVSMPPSAGKTFLAELKIVQRIADTDKLAFYVVPLNTLARQALAELSNRLRRTPLRMNVRVLTGTYDSSDEDLAAIRNQGLCHYHNPGKTRRIVGVTSIVKISRKCSTVLTYLYLTNVRILDLENAA